MNKKVLMVLVIILSIFVLGLSGYLIYDKVLIKDNEMNRDDVLDYPSTVFAEYIASLDLIDNDNSQDSVSVKLSLYNNGVFEYVYSYGVPTGVLGNYVIDGDKVVLTAWFNTGSDVQLLVTKGTKYLTINQNGNIVDTVSDGYKLKNGEKTIELVKGKELTDSFDVSNKLGASFFNEEYHTFEKPNFL